LLFGSGAPILFPYRLFSTFRGCRKIAHGHLVRLAELAAGRRILEGGQVVPLDSTEWAERWDRHQQRGDPK
jgi:hypothetical protein